MMAEVQGCAISLMRLLVVQNWPPKSMSYLIKSVTEMADQIKMHTSN